MAEVPEGGTKLKRVLGCPPRRRPPVGYQAGDGFVKLLGPPGGTELHHALDLDRSEIALGMADAGWDHDRLTGSGRHLFTGEGEVGFAGHDGETFFLFGMDVFGDGAAGLAAPVEADQVAAVVFGDGRVLDPFAGGRVEEKKGRKVAI